MINKLSAIGVSVFTVAAAAIIPTTATEIRPEWTISLATIIPVGAFVLSGTWWAARWMAKIERRMEGAESWRESFDKRLERFEDKIDKLNGGNHRRH